MCLTEQVPRFVQGPRQQIDKVLRRSAVPQDYVLRSGDCRHVWSPHPVQVAWDEPRLAPTDSQIWRIRSAGKGRKRRWKSGAELASSASAASCRR